MVDGGRSGRYFLFPDGAVFLRGFQGCRRRQSLAACLYGNYAGDNMNVKMAQRMAGEKGHSGQDCSGK